MKRAAKNRSIVYLLISFLLWAGFACADEPAPPVVDTPFDPETESEMDQLASMPIDQAFKQLANDQYFRDEKALYKAIFKAFKERKKEALDFAAGNLKFPVIEKREGKTVNKNYEFNIAKKMFEVFPDDAIELLTQLYNSGDPITRENVINAAGNVTGTKTRKLLMDALDDKTHSEQTYPESMGESMRICDDAYNQLVLRYRVKNVLRTIGPVYDVEDRDYHISVLNNLLENGSD